MKPWDELTESGRFRRLRSLALSALDRYDLHPERLRLVGGFTNVIYRVDTRHGRCALRIDYMEDHSDESTAVELAWLAALAAETELDVCRVIPAQDGGLSVRVGAPGVPGERRCVLFEWVPGNPLERALTAENYEKLGRLSAGLHVHGSSFDPPHDPMSWDRIFYWDEAVDPVVHHLAEHAHHFGRGRRETLERAIDAVEPAFANLDREQTQIIHADLHPGNVHVHRSRLVALDFEDVAWGHRVQDVSVTLFYERDRPHYAELRAAFEQGYRAIAPWPVAYEGELEHFMAARTLMFINFVLNLGDDPASYFDIAFPRLERFLASWAS